MKKLIALMMTMILAVSVFAACGKAPQPAETTQAPTEAVTEPATEPAAEPDRTAEVTGETGAPADLGKSSDALAILEAVWADYAEEDKFPVSGGDFDAGTFVMGAPGPIDMNNAAALQYALLLSEEALAQADGAATLMHGMNGNIFSSGLIHMTEEADLTAIAEQVKESILHNQWLCGAPETMLIASIDGEYLLISFGNGEIMASFQGHLENVVPQMEILHTGAIFE